MPDYSRMGLIYSIYLLIPILYVFYHTRTFYTRESMRNKVNEMRYRRLCIAASTMFLLFVFNLTYTGMFGWNEWPQSSLELVLDIIVQVGLVVSFLFMFVNRKPIKGGHTNVPFM